MSSLGRTWLDAFRANGSRRVMSSSSLERLGPAKPPPPEAPPVTMPRPGWPAPVLELGKMVHFAAVTLRTAVRPPYAWFGEFLLQLGLVIRTCLFPVMLCSFALAFGPMGVQASGFFEVFGTYDRMGGIYEIVVVRLFAPLVVGIVLAGAAGTAICADLGARVVRDEVAALAVMGVDTMRSLIVPRVLALTVAALLFVVVAGAAGLLGALLVLAQRGADVEPFWSVFIHNATTLELAASVVKAGIYGAVIAIVACYKGLNVSGGPEGVGRAVNQSVVVAFLAIGFIDYFFTQLLLATNPELSQVRG